MRGTDEAFDELSDEVLFMDIFGALAGYDLTQPQKGHFKCFKSHYAFDQLPECCRNAKFILILRDPHDVFASMNQWESRFTWALAPYADIITQEDYYRERYVVLM